MFMFVCVGLCLVCVRVCVRARVGVRVLGSGFGNLMSVFGDEFRQE